MHMMMHYPHWNYITVPSFMFRCVTVCELRLFKRKKKKKKKKQKKKKNVAMVTDGLGYMAY